MFFYDIGGKRADVSPGGRDCEAINAAHGHPQHQVRCRPFKTEYAPCLKL